MRLALHLSKACLEKFSTGRPSRRDGRELCALRISFIYGGSLRSRRARGGQRGFETYGGDCKVCCANEETPWWNSE